MISVFVLVCALATTPDHCGRATALYFDRVGDASNDMACMMSGINYAAAHYEIDSEKQYAKVQCVHGNNQPNLG